VQYGWKGDYNTAMATKRSAGMVLYRVRDGDLEVFLVHPGGPYWSNKDDGAWSIPKGEFEEGEDPLTAARREFREETGFEVSGPFRALSPLKQPSGKVIHAWAVEGDIDPARVASNTFSMEWPPHSGKQRDFPEVDKAGWFSLATAPKKMIPGQRGFLDQLQQLVKDSGVRQVY
jgi:predicted NUDIX family NTP pyrophosphohydrolase